MYLFIFGIPIAQFLSVDFEEDNVLECQQVGHACIVEEENLRQQQTLEAI